MESRFGHDFSRVRVHADARADEAARAHHSVAFTRGSHIAFAAGRYAPQTSAGKRLLAHELTHVLQQDGGSREQPGSAHEQEAERAAALVESASPLSVRGTSAAGVPQFAADVPAAAAAAPRLIFLDTNVVKRIAEGHKQIEAKVAELKAAGHRVVIGQQVYNELLRQPSNPATVDSHRNVLERLNIEPGPTGTLAQREELYAANRMSLGPPTVKKGQVKDPWRPHTVLSQADLMLELPAGKRNDELVAGQAKAAGGELLTLDTGFFKPEVSKSVAEGGLGARIAPESHELLAALKSGPGGTSTPGGTPPAPTGASGPKPAAPTAKPAPASPPKASATTSAKGETKAYVGEPDMTPVVTGGPSARGVGLVSGLQLILEATSALINLAADHEQSERTHAARARILPQAQVAVSQHPHRGVLLIYNFSQRPGSPDAGSAPRPVFEDLDFATGLTQDEALDNYRAQPTLKQGRAAGTTFSHAFEWFPPLRPAGVERIRTTFPKVARATFVSGRARLQDVAWNGTLMGFDDEGQTSLSGVDDKVPPEFFVLRVPSPFITYIDGSPARTDIPITELAAGAGGNIPVVNLDPTVPLFHVTAACVFPADEYTEALFNTARGTDIYNSAIAYLNFGKVRWARPENIRLLS